MRRFIIVICLALFLATSVEAAEVSGRVTDSSGAVLSGATLTLLNVASGQQTTLSADADGRYQFQNLTIGIYRVAASFLGFSESSRTIVVLSDTDATTVDFALAIGSLRSEVTVAADRGVRDLQTVPLRADTLPGEVIRELVPVSTGDALVAAPGVTPVGSGPFQVRPRLRGLDSTRVLVLVDGERLNNARTSTDRAGIEVGLVDPDSIERLEVIGGAGSVLYGTDALSGTINIVTNRPQLTDAVRVTAGFDGFYSSNENGRRGTVSLGVSSSRFAVSFLGGGEHFDDYSSGKDFDESSQALHDEGRIVREDTIDTNFGFTFGRFPDAFNAPFTRTSAVVANSGMNGSSANLAGIVRLAPNQTIDFKYQRRRAENVGFPDFVTPFFFQQITLPESQLDKVSGTYVATDLTPWLRRLSATTYYQKQNRLLRNQFPVQFPVPTPVAFFPISVFHLDILSDTRQQVSTPGVDVQATLLPAANNVLTVGTTILSDRSEDERTTSTVTSQVGRVALGMFGPAATVFSSPIVFGPAEIEHPVRVPNASFRDVGLFMHDEWTASADLRLTAGLRLDRYVVTTEATPGYDIASLITGAEPPIDPATLPNINGDRVARTALTGEAGIVFRAEQPVSYFAHYVRSYRHPNLEELLFSGPATAGNIVPNITVEPETGHNVDVGTRLRFSRFVGALSYFNNTYSNFISTEVVAELPDNDSISQAINLARVRIQGVEGEGSAPFLLGSLTWLPSAGVAYNYGTVLEGTTPLTGESLAGEPQDNITPWKISAGLRVSDRRERWWASYGIRTQTDVTRVSPLLEDSSFLIAQDLFGLSGFSVQRLAGGYDWRAGGQQVGVTLSVDNLTDRFYREQFQFAPARGRSISVAFRIRGVR